MGNMLRRCAAAALCGAVAALNLSQPVLAVQDYTLGDVNGDGVVTSADASEILRFYARESSGGQPDGWNTERMIAANVDFNKNVTAADASLTLKYYCYLSGGGSDPSDTYFRRYKEFTTAPYSEVFSLKRKVTANSSKRVTISWEDLGDTVSYDFEMYYMKGKDTKEYVVRNVHTDNNYVVVDMPYYMNINSSTYFCYTIQPYSEFCGEVRKWDFNEFSGFTESAIYTQYKFNDCKLTPHDSYPLYNIKGDKPYQSDTFYISDEDRRIMDEFAKEHFTDDMTRYDKLNYLADWLNENVIYAEGDLYNEIIADSWVKACLAKKLGQCLQYNGAMAEFMAYMGYDVYMLEMWLEGNSRQHFRSEVNIDGQAYSIEVGNASSGYDMKWGFSPIKSSIE
ncbi:MAG: hypothetical protein IIZ18_02785 [Ruminococcus sp.]|nr:hypothetical protein [Ruminococcus sp.]